MAVQSRELNEMDIARMMSEANSGGAGGFADLEIGPSPASSAAPSPASRRPRDSARSVPPPRMGVFRPTYAQIAAQVGDLFGLAASLYGWYLGSRFLLLWLAQLGATWAGDYTAQTVNLWAFAIPVGITALQRALMPSYARSRGEIMFWSVVTLFGVIATYFGAKPWLVAKVAAGVPLVFPFHLAPDGGPSWGMIVALIAGALLLEIGPEIGAVYFGRRAWARGETIARWLRA